MFYVYDDQVLPFASSNPDNSVLDSEAKRGDNSSFHR